MTHLQIKISLPIHNDTCLVYLALVIVVYTRLLGKDGEEKVVAVVEGGRRRSNAAKNLRMLKRDSCCPPPMDWWPVTLGGVELTTVQTFYLQSGLILFLVFLIFRIILKLNSYISHFSPFCSFALSAVWNQVMKAASTSNYSKLEDIMGADMEFVKCFAL